MKDASAGFITHVGREVTAFKTLWRVTRRDGTKYHFTDNSKNLTLDPDAGPDEVTFSAAGGYTRSSIMNTASLSVDNLDITSHLDPNFTNISEADIRAGLYDFAEVEMWMVVFLDTTLGVMPLRRGYLGQVSLRDDIYYAEFRGLVQLLTQSIVEVYSPQCRADLGDTRCRVPLFPDVVLRSTAYAAGDYIRASSVMENIPEATLLVPGDADADDISQNAATGTLGSLAAVQTVESKYGGGSIEFSPTASVNPSNSFVSYPDIAAYAIGTNEFTVEGWFRWKSISSPSNVQTLMSQYINTGSQRSWFLRWNGTLPAVDFVISADGIGVAATVVGASFTPTVGQWYHIAAARDDVGDVRIFIDGVQSGSTVSYAGTVFNSTEVVRIGKLRSAGFDDQPFNGFADDCRFVNGLGVYTGTFTPPTGALPVGPDDLIPGLVTADFDDRIYLCTTGGITSPVQPAYDTTVSNDTVDGAATFTAVEAWTRAGTVATADDNRTFTLYVSDPRSVDGWFDHGAVKWETGNNAVCPPMEVSSWLASVTTGVATLSVADSNTFSRAIGSFVADGFQIGMKIDTVGFSNLINNGTFTIAGVTATTIDVEEAVLLAEAGDGDEQFTSIGEVTLFLGMPFVVEAGDTVSIYRGCNKGADDCKVFDNIKNYRGEPFVPGTDTLMRSPDAPQG